MDRSMQLRHLAQAERHIELGKKHIADQEERLAKREIYGGDATASRALLETFQHIAHRDLILKELGQ
jgi:hypothetical protein